MVHRTFFKHKSIFKSIYELSATKESNPESIRCAARVNGNTLGRDAF